MYILNLCAIKITMSLKTIKTTSLVIQNEVWMKIKSEAFRITCPERLSRGTRR